MRTGVGRESGRVVGSFRSLSSIESRDKTASTGDTADDDDARRTKRMSDPARKTNNLGGTNQGHGRSPAVRPAFPTTPVAVGVVGVPCSRVRKRRR